MTFTELNEAAGRIAHEAGYNPAGVAVQIVAVGSPVRLVDYLVMLDGRGATGVSADEALERFADMLGTHHTRASQRLSLLGELPQGDAA